MIVIVLSSMSIHRYRLWSHYSVMPTLYRYTCLSYTITAIIYIYEYVTYIRILYTPLLYYNSLIYIPLTTCIHVYLHTQILWHISIKYMNEPFLGPNSRVLLLLSRIDGSTGRRALSNRGIRPPVTIPALNLSEFAVNKRIQACLASR